MVDLPSVRRDRRSSAAWSGHQPVPLSFDYIRQHYGVPAGKGVRVRYTGDCTKRGKPRLGTITAVEGAHLRIRMDGDNFSQTYHPTWELEYLAAPAD